MIKTLLMIFSLTLFAFSQQPIQVNDPYPGSGGLFFGTPNKKDIDSGEINFSIKRFSSFSIGKTTKAELVNILGTPLGWTTNPDNSSMLQYAYMDTESFLGMQRIMHTSFSFNKNQILIRIMYPNFDSNITPIHFNGVKYINYVVDGKEYYYRPEGQSNQADRSDDLNVQIHGNHNSENLIDKIIDRKTKSLQKMGGLIYSKPPTQDGNANKIQDILIITLNLPKIKNLYYTKFYKIKDRLVSLEILRRNKEIKDDAEFNLWIKQNIENIDTGFEKIDLKELDPIIN